MIQPLLAMTRAAGARGLHIDGVGFRLKPLRRLLLQLLLRHGDCDDAAGLEEIHVRALNDCLGAIKDEIARGGDGAVRMYFAGATSKRRGAYLFPSRAMMTRLRMALYGRRRDEEERAYCMKDLEEVDARLTEKDPDRAPVITPSGKRAHHRFFAGDERERPIPESYLSFFFPRFRKDEFLRKRIEIYFTDSPLFSPPQILFVQQSLSGVVRQRNPAHLRTRIRGAVLRGLAAAGLLILLVPLSFDLFLLFYGFGMNDYTYTLPSFQSEMKTAASPFALRAQRVNRMNRAASPDDFEIMKGGLRVGTRYEVRKDSQIAVELNYDEYRRLRRLDQQGFTAVAVDRRRLEIIRKENPARYRRLAEAILNLRWWEIPLEWVHGVSGGVLSPCDPADAAPRRLKDDLLARLKKDAAPMRFVDSLGAEDVITAIYYKPNTKRWMDLDMIPAVMVEAVIIREDRRFRNDLFPLPHRGNDNLVIVPRMAKKMVRRTLKLLVHYADKYGNEWMRGKAARLLARFEENVSRTVRGGSSLSNQLMELLYTRYVPRATNGGFFHDPRVRQKKHELTASAMVHWFWSEDQILEAYVNEVYGGHLYSDIRGFASQASMYFSRGLDECNLREQIMIVAAVKKPSYIKDYARWLKAKELSSLMDADRTGVARWIERNRAYGVTVRNYRDILRDRDGSGRWLNRRINYILKRLRDTGAIAPEECEAALEDAIRFDFNRGIRTADIRLANCMARELDRGLGPGRSDSGTVVCTTIRWDLQKRLQKMMDEATRKVEVSAENRVNGQPGMVLLEGGARIIEAHRIEEGRPVVLNRVVAHVGGASRQGDEWDWVSQANRSLGSSLKPMLDMLFLLMGYGLDDMLKDEKVTYKTYSLEQRRIFRNFIRKNPARKEAIKEIERFWKWSPRNYGGHTGRWRSVREALVRSVNSIHVKIQEIVTPEIFASFLNEIMSIEDVDSQHRPYRSLVLGGSGGDQRFERYLQAYSLFPNRGRVTRHTMIDSLLLPDGAEIKPRYRAVTCDSLSLYSQERIGAAGILIGFALRDIVKRGTMAAMGGIGAGKTGTSDELRDAMATVHFPCAGSTYIAGVRIGNRDNYSIGGAADRLAVPLLKRIVTGIFDEEDLMKGDEYDDYLAGILRRHGEIVEKKGRYYLRGGDHMPRKLRVSRIQKHLRKLCLMKADEDYEAGDFSRAARSYENYLRRALSFDSRSPVFHRMVVSLIRSGNIDRAGEVIERFSVPGTIARNKNLYARKFDVELKADPGFYADMRLDIGRMDAPPAARRRYRRQEDSGQVTRRLPVSHEPDPPHEKKDRMDRIERKTSAENRGHDASPDNAAPGEERDQKKGLREAPSSRKKPAHHLLEGHRTPADEESGSDEPGIVEPIR